MAAHDKPKQKKEPHRNPWDIPPFPEKGDDIDATTYEWIGRALTAWEAFELAFSQMFGWMIGLSESLLPAIRAYGSVLTFRGRSDMVRAASEVFFMTHPNPTLKADVNNLIKTALNYSPRRNEIAHGIVLQYFQFFQYERIDKRGYCVGATAYATNKQHLHDEFDGEVIRARPTYCYASAELSAFAERFTLDLMQPAQILGARLFRARAAKQKASP